LASAPSVPPLSTNYCYMWLRENYLEWPMDDSLYSTWLWLLLYKWLWSLCISAMQSKQAFCL